MSALTFTRFDLASWFPRRQNLLTLTFAALAGVALPVPGMAVVAAALVTSLMVSAPFLGDERGRLNTLYGVLPVSRRSVVLGRALSVLVYYLVAAVVGTVVTLVVAAVRGDALPAPELLVTVHAIAFAVVGVAMAVQLPALFRVGYSAGRLIAYAPAFLIACLAWLAQATGVLAPLAASASEVPVAVVAAAGFGLGVLGIVVGTALAVHFYRTREL
ncbi:ABC-2 transporter permease [Desertihabitans aurantiacus]|uniref:ABC-2 transporter permease n=1 Tax=Desertihabitans aurantiacus TaxID=2282477 RepID=UPI000DF7F4DD|nr:ABC-2 transporter permease [Desertihabitans aurantiacus]